MSQAVPLQVVKRDGRIVPFDRSRIERAVSRVFDEVYGPEERSHEPLLDVVEQVMHGINGEITQGPGASMTVEMIQDRVEQALMAQGRYAAAKAYILYREEHRKLRSERPIPEEVRAAFAADERYFPTALQKFQFYDKYSRFNYALGRRETWVETVDRAVHALYGLAGDRLPSETYAQIHRGILEMKVMPSMRLLAMAGPAFDRSHITGYNCSFMGADSIDAFVEALIISMAGCGVGYSVESKYVDRLPAIRPQSGWRPVIPTWVVQDSTEGWAEALRYGLETWFEGADVEFNFELVRPAGTPLLTKGGRASGPEPLKHLLDFCRAKVLSRQGKRLRPLDVHDMLCAIGQGVVSGGVRRTAMIALFDEDDEAMLHCKDGDFERDNSQRWNANNSAVTTMDDPIRFLERFTSMLKAGRGEPGIFNPQAALDSMPSRRRETIGDLIGTNPCGEIVLQSQQFCNLSAAVLRADDTFESLREKVALATVIGTIQSLATHFPGLRPAWARNCEAERLLGVDITGQQDNPALLTPRTLDRLRSDAVFTNLQTAQRLGINPSASVTCVKPSGNTSQLVDCASGLHARWAPYYIRNVRVAATSPLARVLRDAGAPMSPENGDDPESPRTWVVSFPVKAPDGAVARNDRSAIEQCEWWLKNKTYWTEHNPSVTITYRPDEAVALTAWVWNHRDRIGGMAFLPAFDAKYDQLPYVEVDQETYERLAAAFPPIDFSKVWRYEASDMTTATQELACSAGLCLIEP